MEIIIENENTQLAPYNLNLEQAKKFLTSELEKYKNLCVSKEYMSSAKESRAELNKMRAEIKSRLMALKKKHLEPFEAVKAQADELEALIEEPLKQIDEKIKEIEQKIRDDKQKEIETAYSELLKKHELKIDLQRIWNAQWLTQAYSMKKIKEEITYFLQRVKGDLEVIAQFDKEYTIPLVEEYQRTFDMSKVMQLKIKYDQAKQEKLEKEAKERDRIERENAERIAQEEARKKAEEEEKQKKQTIIQEIVEEIEQEEIPDEPQGSTTEELFEQLTNTNNHQEKCNIELSSEEEKPKTKTNPPASEQKEEKVLMKVWFKVTPAQRLKMREFVIANGIECGALED